MKYLSLIVVSSLVLGLVACVTSQGPIPDSQIGLSKTSAFDTPTPMGFTRDGTGAGGAAEAAYGMPPLIPHATAAYEPITPNKNMCTTCHTRATRSSMRQKGQPTAIPASHYKGDQLRGDQYYCGVCHAPAANVPDLVVNTGPKPKR